MQLAIDTGNTDIVFGIYDQGKWLHQWRMPSREEPSWEVWGYRLATELLELGYRPKDIDRAVISSVVPDLKPLLADMVEKVTGNPPIIVGPEVYPHLAIKITRTEEIGTDLVANATAAYDRFKEGVIIVDFGTALTFTAVAKDGELLGVAIAPGLKTAINSLFQKTAQLPEVPLAVPDSALGRSTIHAIQAGTVLGYVGMVRYLLDQIKAELNDTCKVVATGGLSSILTPLEKDFDEIDRMLTMKGLILIGEQYHSK